MSCWRVFSLIFAVVFSSARAEVLINEIHYNPPVKTERSEFVELYNSGPVAVSLAGWKLDGAVEFVFPPGSSIAPSGYAVVGEDPATLKTRFGVAALGPWEGLLSNEGESLEVRDALGALIDKVTYQLGFPWPTVGDPPGYSIELVNPAFDNDLGGNWRRSVRGSAAISRTTLIPQKSQWKYRKGTAEPSTATGAWRAPDFDDDSWSIGAAPIGYDPAIAMGTVLDDMRNNYTSFYLRKTFQVADATAIGSLTIDALYDDGFQVWINGQRVVNASLPDRQVAYNELSTGAARESDAYDPFVITAPDAFLRTGENTIAVQVHNVSLAGSTDAYFDLQLTADLGSSNAGPTPGARNSVFETNSPPAIRQVTHTPEQPASGQSVTVTARITDPDGVASVQLLYQLVEPGNYIELNDPAYESGWISVPMQDDGTAGDLKAADSIYTGVLPSSLQIHRRLIRYRIVAKDGAGLSVRVPYEGDPEPNFAYFVYDGVPGWSAAIDPGSADAGLGPVQNFSAAEMGRLPTYHLLSKRNSVEDATWNSKYGGDLYRWWGTLVYDGKVYDHIRYRARGGVWRYAMGKNMWKFDLNRGHEFQARDNYGRKYNTPWKKVNLGANIQQGDFLHRGEQGMFESVGFALFNLVGVEAPTTQWINFRVIDEPGEAPAANQYGGDYWGLYLAIEQEDGRFLDEHDLPDGNLYKMEGGTGELNNQGHTAASDKSDLNSFLSAYRSGNPDEAWWRANFDLNEYYSYQTIVQGIHHYDICDGKNYFYFLNPETGKWSVHTWDLDLTWADNMYRDCDGADPFHSLVVPGGKFNREFNNRAREIRDLLFNTDEGLRLLDEYASIVKGTNIGPNILAADRAMWDYNPVLANPSISNPSKAGQGLFYQFPFESSRNPVRRGSFEAAVDIMKDYLLERSAFLDERIADPLIPNRPSISYIGSAGFPLNRVELQSSPYFGSGPFAGMEWRVGEVRAAAPGVPGIYEIEPVWQTPELTAFKERIAVPAERLRVGHTYRARVRMKDTTGRWSNWSAPLEFTAAEPDGSVALQQYLRPTEIMYNPPPGPEWEFLELRNISSNVSLQLAGASFTDGIAFTFPADAALSPGEYLLLVKADPTNNFAGFRQFYAVDDSMKIYGPYGGSLDNSGERLTLKTALAGSEIFSFVYDDAGDWPLEADGGGYSLVPRDETSTSLDDAASWRSSRLVNGSPGRADVSGLNLRIAKSGAGIVLHFLATPGKTYRLEYRNAFNSDGWQTLREISNASGAISVDEPLPLSHERFYRLVEL